VAAIATITLVCAAYVVSLGGPVQLSKQEALTLMNLQAKALMAEADRNEYAQMLYVKYGIAPEHYNLDIARGCFVLRTVPPVEEENEEDPSPTIN
jgi:hypothetical protein